MTCLPYKGLCSSWRCLHYGAVAVSGLVYTVVVVLVLDSMREISSSIPRNIYFEILLSVR